MTLPSSALSALRKIIGWLFAIAERAFCQKAYAISTLYRHHRQMIDRSSRPLGKHLCYVIYWDEYILDRRQSVPSIELRSIDGQALSKVVISVSAYNERVCYQDCIALYDVDERAHRAALSSVPFRRLKFSGNRLYTPYDRFRVRLIEILDQAGNSLLPSSRVEGTVTPMDRLEVALGKEKGYVERWGRVYHLGYLEMEISEQSVYFSSWRFSRLALLRWCAPLLMHRTVATAIFWCRNAVFARPLERRLVRYLGDYDERKKLRLEESRA